MPTTESRFRQRYLTDVLTTAPVLAAVRAWIEAGLARQEAVASPNIPGDTEIRRRAAIGTAEAKSAQAEQALTKAVRDAVKDLAMREIQ